MNEIVELVTKGILVTMVAAEDKPETVPMLIEIARTDPVHYLLAEALLFKSLLSLLNESRAERGLEAVTLGELNDTVEISLAELRAEMK